MAWDVGSGLESLKSVPFQPYGGSLLPAAGFRTEDPKFRIIHQDSSSIKYLTMLYPCCILYTKLLGVISGFTNRYQHILVKFMIRTLQS